VGVGYVPSEIRAACANGASYETMPKRAPGVMRRRRGEEKKKKKARTNFTLGSARGLESHPARIA